MSNITINGQEYSIVSGADGFKYYRVAMSNKFGKKVKAKDNYIAVWNSNTGTPNPDIGINNIPWGVGSEEPVDYKLDISDLSGISLYSSSSGVAGSNSTISNDGLQLYSGGGTSDTKIYQYTLTTPWDLSTGSLTNTFSTGLNASYFSRVVSCDISPDGTKLVALYEYVLANPTDPIIRIYELTTPWDLSTAVIEKTRTLSLSLARYKLKQVKFINNGYNIIFIHDDDVYIVDLDDPYNIDNITYGTSVATTNSDVTSIDFTYDGYGALGFIPSGSSGEIYSYELTTPFDISTMTLSDSISVGPDTGKIYIKEISGEWYIVTVSSSSIKLYTTGFSDTPI